ncbi:MAG: hypothetical protein FOGNACKC_03060 [Anaerolineae bacterium]|nr:hypothetical protein [Anaerolineae bacterium]
MFAANEGTIDRVVRIIVGLVLVGLGFFSISGAVGVIVGILGLILLVTGAIGWCPLYMPFKINTRKS